MPPDAIDNEAGGLSSSDVWRTRRRFAMFIGVIFSSALWKFVLNHEPFTFHSGLNEMDIQRGAITADSLFLNNSEERILTLKERQIRNYVNGTGLMLNIHITHHAGTTFCGKMNKVGPTPEFACMGGKTFPSNETKLIRKPWAGNDTAFMVQHLRSHFHMVSWEFRGWGNLHHTTNWEHEKLLSVIVMRDPIDRFMAGGKCHKNNIKDPTPETQHDWWEYANEKCADNYALRVLAPEKGCCDRRHLEGAKDLLRRFTFILDQACLDDSMGALADRLNISVDLSKDERKKPKKHESARTRMANDTLYDYVKKKFRRDIELYEWSKTQSLVDCSQLSKKS